MKLRQLVQLVFIAYLLINVISLLSSCCSDKEDEVQPVLVSRSITVKPETTSVLVNVRNETDGVTIPVLIEFPKDRSTPLKGLVVLHGSGGPWHDSPSNCNVGVLSSQYKQWRDLIYNKGMLAAFPDSYSPRGTCENEGDYKKAPLNIVISAAFVRNADAYATLDLLRRLTWSDTGKPVMDPENIAVIGFSDGGSAAVSTLFDTDAVTQGWKWQLSYDGVIYDAKPPVIRPSGGGFKAGVVYYGGAYHRGYFGNICEAGKSFYRTYCDVMFHIPSNDDLSENMECLLTTMKQNGGGQALVYRYDNTGHGFDSDVEPQSSEARDRTFSFLKEKLGM